jgi:glycosyltransferase involved in cell wall biosynthesis
LSARTSRIVVHDYSGHPGQAQLSRALARRGYQVTHQYCPSYTTGRGSLQHQPADPATLAFEPVEMDGTFAKYSARTRLRQELQYGRTAARAIAAKEPAVAVISNVPLLAHWVLARRLSRLDIPMVFWHQDIYSAAISATARKRIPFLGRLIGVAAEVVERKIARRSAGIIAISPTFIEKLASWGVEHKSIVVPNWAPIDEMPVRPRRNAWSERMGLSNDPVVLYSGTLGLKHDPSILAVIAAELELTRPDAKVVVISEGKGREWLEDWKRQQGADNLVLLDFQPYEELPDVLASADLLVAILEPDASKFSVPSKVLTYLCAERAILGVIPPDNSVAEILMTQGAGSVVDPGRRDHVATEVIRLLNDDDHRGELGRSGRRYAEGAFSADSAADRFISVFGAWVAQPEPDQVTTKQPLDAGRVAASERRQWEPSPAQAAS